MHHPQFWPSAGIRSCVLESCQRVMIIFGGDEDDDDGNSNT